ncbi:lipopolysaccharide heptosyltransferase family protein [Pantoea brenneri]|uniref:glycosyltransferase family 9 protein n=1 Tax=Pantoea brenneri TaxID=472694 RepID=UPI00210E569D|nr:glycosyltransferase family 9 protein [Pantoea brenneri]MCQ5471326.1 lipopolysaccharide heptosyltransferase family protein [Pantoea brenneri]
MNKDVRITVSQGSFKKIREWNRRRNYFLKEVKLEAKISIAKLLWDKRNKVCFEPDSVKRILLVRNEGKVGDIIVSTPLIRSLHQAGYIVDLLVTEACYGVMQYSPFIRHIYKAADCSYKNYLKSLNHTVSKSTMSLLNKNKYDLIIDPCLSETPVHRLKLFRDINARFVIGLNKKSDIRHYTVSVSYKNEKQHVTELLSLISKCIGIEATGNVTYSLHFPDVVLDEVRHFLSPWKKIIINAFAGTPERNFSQQQLLKIIKMINDNNREVKVIILDHRNEMVVPLPDNVVKNPFYTLHHVMALVKESDAVITPDTSIVHIAAAWKKPLIAVYKNSPNNNMWAPGYEKASHIIVHDDKTSDVENIPERILNELIRRNLLGKREVNIQESVSVIVLREPVSAQSYLAHYLCIASSDQHYCGLVNKA